MTKVKKQKPSIKPCTNCFNPKYIKINLSYFKPEKNFFRDYGGQMLKRLHEISLEEYLIATNWRKEIGFEFEQLDIGREIPKEFQERFQEKNYSKLAIVRLYPNNNPIMGRIVGVVINKIYYVFYVFIGETGYKR